MRQPLTGIYTRETKAGTITAEQIRDFGLVDLMAPEDAPQLAAPTAYREVGWFRRCVSLRARSVASLPWSIYRAGGDEPIVSDTDPMPAELAWLDIQSRAFKTMVAILLHGASYEFKVMRGSKPIGLQWFNPSTVEVKADHEGIKAYIRRINNRRFNVDPELVLAVFDVDPFVEIGRPMHTDATAAAQHALVLKEFLGYTAEQLHNGLVNRTLFVADGPRPKEEVRVEVESFLRRIFKRRGDDGVKVIGGKLDTKQIGANLSDLTSMELAEEHQRAIATSLGVPHSLVMSDASTYATAQADQANMILHTTQHDARLIEDQWNAKLFEALGLEFKFEVARAEALQYMEAQKAEQLRMLVDAGILTKNEVRAQIGYEPLEEPEVPAAFAANQAPSAEAAEVDPDDQETGPAKHADDVRRWRKVWNRHGLARALDFNPDTIDPETSRHVKAMLSLGFDIDEALEASGLS